MDSRTASAAYREATLESAPPIKIVRLLYEGVLRLLDQAAATDPKHPRSQFVECLTRADGIVSELRLSLEHEHAPQIAGDLARLYLFAEGRIQEALWRRDPAPIAEARAVLTRLQDAWSRVVIESPSN